MAGNSTLKTTSVKYVWGSIRLLFSACYPEFILLLKDNP
jgi:hypothetical protein